MGQLEQITASAGSGKTYTLILRFLELLAAADRRGELALRDLAGHDPAGAGKRPHAWPEILAATFTNAAASEMKERLVRELKKYALSGPQQEGAAPALFSPAEADERLDIMLRRFGSLNIRTIDSLLTMLVRLSALDLGLPPDFQPVFDDGLPAHFELFFDEAQEVARSGDETLQGLLLACCDAVLADERRGGFMAPADLPGMVLKLIVHIWRQGPFKNLATGEALERAARDLRQETAQAALALHTCIGREELDCDKRFMAFLGKFGDWSRGGSGGRGGRDDLLGSRYLQRASLAACVNKKSAPPSEQAETAFSLLQFACAQAATELAKLHAAASLLPYARLAAHLAGPFRAWLAQRGLIPSELLGGYAREVLARDLGPSEAYCRFGARLGHLLMDEFQDTSREQWQAIAPLAAECLAGGGDVVYVGDVKQAIYGWRGGDAALFQEVAADPELAGIAGEATITALPANWRSLGRIVELNNTVFGALGCKEIALGAAAALLGPDCPADIVAETAREFMETFGAAAQTLPPGREADRERGHVRLIRLGGGDAAGSGAALEGAAAGQTSDGEAGVDIYYADGPGDEFSVVADSESNLSGYADLQDKPRRIYIQLRALLLDDILARRRPGEIAILTRGNQAARMLARWLTAWGVPTLTENSLLLSEHPLIGQIIAFLKFMDNPLDDPALFEFMCGEDIFLPLSGLDAGGLHDWLLGLADSDGHLLTAVRRDFPAAWERWLAPFYQRAGLMSAYDLVSEMLEHFAVWQRRPGDGVFLRRFLELLHGAEERDMKSLPEFLEWWEASGGVEKLPVAESLDAVRIMTMHKAKGLEFPVLIVPFNDFMVKASDDFKRAESPGGEVLLKDRKAAGDPYFRNLSRQAREAMHLVYVAWTRASEELYALLPPAEGDDAPTAGKARSAGAGVPVSRALDILLDGLPFDADGIHASGKVFLPVSETSHPAVLAAEYSPLSHAPQSGLRGEEGSGEGELKGIIPLGSLSPVSPSSPPLPAAPMSWLPRLKIYRNVREGQGQAARERGVLIHNCLENLRFAGGGTEAAHKAALDAFMHARRVLNLPRLEEGLYREIMDLLTWVLSLPEAGSWFAAGSPEQEILTRDGQRKIADRLVPAPGRDIILEYKTGGLDLPAAALPLPEHVAQLRGYLALLKDIRHKPAQGHLLYLDRREVYRVTLEEAGA